LPSWIIYYNVIEFNAVRDELSRRRGWRSSSPATAIVAANATRECGISAKWLDHADGLTITVSCFRFDGKSCYLMISLVPRGWRRGRVQPKYSMLRRANDPAASEPTTLGGALVP
jgi:hypothetical protein